MILHRVRYRSRRKRAPLKSGAPRPSERASPLGLRVFSTMLAAGCCAAGCATDATCKAAACKCVLPPKLANVMYVITVVVAVVVALSLRASKVDMHVCVSDCGDGDWSPTNGSVTESLCSATPTGETPACAGNWAAFRISFVLVVFFMLLLVLTSVKSVFSVVIHRGFWIGKILLIGALLAACVFIENETFAVYAWIARCIAPFFLIYQLVFFIDFGYRTNARWVEYDEEEVNFLGCTNGGFKWKGYLLSLSALMFAGCILGISFMYRHWDTGCAFNVIAITSTAAFWVLNTLLSLSKLAPHGSIFTSALVALYSSWLCFSAISSWPHESCNPTYGESTGVKLAVSVILAAATVAYIGLVVGMRHKAGAGDDDDDEPASFWKYHLAMTLLSFYLAMLLTNWGDSEETFDDPSSNTTAGSYVDQHNSGEVSAWALLISSWLCNGLYCWTLIAPILCHQCGREFPGAEGAFD